MTAASLAAIAWVRAQGIYILLHIAGIVLAALAGAFQPGSVAEGAAGVLLVLSMFSCGFAIAFGIPAAFVLIIGAYLAAPAAARARALMPVMTALCLAATVAALAIGFSIAIDEFGKIDELVWIFSGLAMVSMAISVLTLRRPIRELQAWLRGESEMEHEDADEATAIFSSGDPQSTTP